MSQLAMFGAGAAPAHDEGRRPLSDPKRIRFQEEFLPASRPGTQVRGRLALRVLVAKNDAEVRSLLVAALEEDGLAVRTAESTPLIQEVRGYEPGLPALAPAEEAVVPVVRLVGRTLPERLAKLEAARQTMRTLRLLRERPPPPSRPRSSRPAGRRPPSLGGTKGRSPTRPPTRPGSKAR